MTEKNYDYDMLHYTHSASEVLKYLESQESGLTAAEVQERLQKYGPNDLPKEKRTPWWKLFIRQFQSSLIYILLLASVIVFFLGESKDALVILSVLVINAVVGMIQEGRAESTFVALKKFVETSATVMRDGGEMVIDDTAVVPGDILVLKEGDKVPADARIIFANVCKVDESALTGESGSVLKTETKLQGNNVQISDQRNMFFKGTFIVSGRATAVVVATGIHTVIGEISQKISSFDTEMPLKTDIKILSRFIVLVVGVAVAILFVAGLFYGNSVKDMFLTSVAIAVSLVPEGLPIVITLVLAAGVFRMAKQQALVKRLQAVEALGQADVIAVDKTGTITKNELMVERIFTMGQEYYVSGDGYESKGEVSLDGRVLDVANHPELLLMAKTAAFCASARAIFKPQEGVWRVSGDPTEAALYVFGKKLGFDKDEIEKEEPQVADIPFDAKIKYHATIHSVAKKNFLTVIGAPEEVLALCGSVWKASSKKMAAKDRAQFEQAIHKMSSQGLRVLALAISPRASKIVSSESMPNLTAVGLFGMRDVLREGVAQSVKTAEDNGVRVVMITGDHKVTAESIARSAGIFKTGDEVLTGKEIEELSDSELPRRLSKVSVFARVAPEHKFRIVQAYQERGNIVAMTGDGVNDALSLVAADLGVAMGKIGTEVTKEAADIVLLDDNFRSIVSAIEEGRSIYATIRKVLVYLFSTGLGEFLTIVCAVLLALPLPLLPTQILWLNLVTDGFLVVAFAVEPKEILHKKHHNRALIDKTMLIRTILMGVVMTIGSLILFNDLYKTDLVQAGTVVLTVLAVFQWLNVWNCRSESQSIFSSNPFKNPFLVVSTIIAVGLHLGIIYTSFGQKIFHTTPLSLIEWAVILLIGTSIIVVEEIRKLIYRRRFLR